MPTKALKVSILAAVVCALATVSAPAVAQSRVDTIAYGPDRSMLRTGAWTLGLSYAPALVVGIESPLPADRYLLAPVAGPWLDMAQRECISCRHETLNQVMLAIDGIVQGVGALEIFGSFLFPERKAARSSSGGSSSARQIKLTRVVPVRMAGGYGLKANGKF